MAIVKAHLLLLKRFRVVIETVKVLGLEAFSNVDEFAAGFERFGRCSSAIATLQRFGMMVLKRPKYEFSEMFSTLGSLFDMFGAFRLYRPKGCFDTVLSGHCNDQLPVLPRCRVVYSDGQSACLELFLVLSYSPGFI